MMIVTRNSNILKKCEKDLKMVDFDDEKFTKECLT